MSYQRLVQNLGQLNKNVAYPHEIDQARAAAEWLLTNSSKL